MDSQKTDLANFIKYCLGYIRLTQHRMLTTQQRYSVDLSNSFFNLNGLLNGDLDGSLGELINLETFYAYDPKNVPDELAERYQSEKEIANKIEDIYNKYRNDQFTKQIVCNFGYFEIEIPVSESEEEDAQLELDTEEEGEKKVKMEKGKYPLFSIPVKIDKEFGEGSEKYFVFSIDPEVQVNVGMLEKVVGVDTYYQLVEELGVYEIEGKLTLPLSSTETLLEIWHKVKAKLRLSEATFEEASFNLEEVKLALGPKANYFLAEDLQKLATHGENELDETALVSWIQDEELTLEGEIPEEQDLYFPFLYDKYKLRVLSLLGNKASIVQGPPGTGKSETIANVLCHLAATGNRVLFVSQKAQALKVVKDKLKALDVHYLFGYLPNPSSEQLGEEDEVDGIGPQLAALGLHIEKLSYKHQSQDGPDELAPIVKEKQALSTRINTLIESERKYYQLTEELKSLEKFNFSILNNDSFTKYFSFNEWQEINQIIEKLEILNQEIKSYEASMELKSAKKLFSTIDFSHKDYSPTVQKYQEDVRTTAYDRHVRFNRVINNNLRKIRLRELRTKLPREVIDVIDAHLDKDISRIEAEKFLGQLYKYSRYFEQKDEFANLEDSVRSHLKHCGLSAEHFQFISKLAPEGSAQEIENVKEKVLRTQEINKELGSLKSNQNVNTVANELAEADKNRRKRVAQYLQNIVNNNLFDKWKKGITIKQIAVKLGRAFKKSKRAFKTFDKLRKDPDNFNAILDLIPVWMMELDDASRIIPLEAGIFDYVILDEASQCNVAYTLPVMFRAKKALFVGDSEQMRDTTIMFKSNRSFDELARRYNIPDELQIKATGTSVQSVLDIAAMRGLMSVPLRYHYRSPAELIGFSNQYFYKPNGKELIPLNNNYLAYKDTGRIMLVHQVESDWSEEVSDKTNIAEAKAILNFFKSLREDKQYSEKSVGILTFFNAQAAYIRRLFEEAGYREEENNYKVSIIEGIQGDEKDIIIYSFVIRHPDQKKKYVALTGETGDIRADINKGRVNVAFSRARLQAHSFVSMPINEVPDKIWVKKYLEYAEKNGAINFNKEDLKPFDSYFEEEFYNHIKALTTKGYKIQNQVESCGFRLDFVVTNTNNGKRVVIECDGPTHFEDEFAEEVGIYVENDEERQSVLEAAGWSFYRIKYSDWISEGFDKKSEIKEIIGLLA